MSLNIVGLLERLPCMPYSVDFPFRKNTTIGIGGEAPLALYPETSERMLSALQALEDMHIPYCVLGRGANVLVSDRGYKGVVVCTSRVNSVKVHGHSVCAECGAGMEKVLTLTKRNGLGGISYMCGIPASVGGALYMNAGVQNGHIGDRVESVMVFEEGTARTLSKGECAFAYKQTRFMEKHSVILSAKFELIKQLPQCIEKEFDEVKKRRAHLPKGRSMGCIFKNPQGYSAGELIDRVGLKGTVCGGAQISEDHANFIINRGNACAKDVVFLIERMKNKVFSETGIMLAEEIRYIGEF